MGVFQRLKNFFRNHTGIIRIGYIIQNNGKFIATQPGHRSPSRTHC